MARAFIMNPEVLVLQRPGSVFNEVMEWKVLSAIKAHVDERGLAMCDASRHTRRPRSVFFTTDRKSQLAIADLVWVVKQNGSGPLPCSVVVGTSNDVPAKLVGSKEKA